MKHPPDMNCSRWCPKPPRPPFRESLFPMLNAFLLLIPPSSCIPSSLPPPPQGSTRPLSFISIFHISHTLLLPSRPSLFLPAFHPMLASHMLEPFSQSLPLKIQTCKKKKKKPTSFSIKLSPDCHCSCCPFTNLVCLIHSIIVGPGSSAASRQTSPTFLSSFLLYPFLPFSTWLGCLPTGAVMQRSAKCCLLQLTHVGNITGGDILHGLCATRLY